MRTTSSQTRCYWPPFTPLSAEDARPRIVRGEGVHLYDDAGRRYIDGISGSYNHCLGHSNPDLMHAVKQQLDTLVHACNMCSDTVLPQALAEQMRDKLCGTGLSHTFLVTSGSEGVESALKMAWQYQGNLGRPRRTGIVAINGAYHGCTLGAMMATRRAFINEGALAVLSEHAFTMPIPASVESISAWEDLLEAHESTIAAIIVEPIMGMEGTRPLPEGFLRKLSALARKHDVLLICDEVFCGIGRAGTFCESVGQGAQPDIVIFSKCLGGGFPITAVVTTEGVADSFADRPMPLFRHGHTQSGNLLGCRSALFVLDYLDTNRSYEAVKTKGERLLRLFRQDLSGQHGVVGVQGQGLMLSITFDSQERCGRAQIAARQHGAIVGAADKHLKLAPAFSIADDEMRALTQQIGDAIRSLQEY
ncbi:aspartate aminotransferase family protein (plasmid) [Ralstonia syzygii subsp. celebesensis]|uniref:Aspartate aminotransferase family protein n=2 Tax=Ralstonia solanacearum species complex TaxID=3116862 RepID=A0AAD0SDR5_RALSL|nr:MULTISPECIES: aspartate aminotransferase family protein [Ralstonia solanacearum species complex]AQW31770.1 aspartate aminotransferase family protein [blood disease bacterium A2-HR MARDI]AXV84520.1 aspartate aminotransferase family protein [Ralstonia solanacearum]AXW55648.1 aspartate aminotransferase family protein [Ralstonia solanacearum]QQV57179.1 aspartate aminotransferase family protein [Ralstonia syzygii subsp. celebesensis]